VAPFRSTPPIQAAASVVGGYVRGLRSTFLMARHSANSSGERNGAQRAFRAQTGPSASYLHGSGSRRPIPPLPTTPAGNPARIEIRPPGAPFGQY
jgi:hypothetical protein